MAQAAPSRFLLRHRDALRGAAALGPMADLACGRGRNTVALAETGGRVIAADRSREALRAVAERCRGLPVFPVRADLETGHGTPLAAGRCGAIVVARFLFRPLAPALVETLAPGGVLLYETFTQDQAKLPYGPENPDFLLAPGELTGLFPELTVIDYEEGCFDDPQPFHLARLLARRE